MKTSKMQVRTREEFNKYIIRTSTLPTGIDGPTPFILVEDIINNMDKVDWSNPNLKILDPAFGFGTFLFVCYIKLIEFHSEEHILNNMLYGIEIEPFRYTLVKTKFAIKNLYLGDFLDPNDEIKRMLNMVKFDVIVGNPPYQDTSKTEKGGSTLWANFANKCISTLLKENGYMAYVTPSAWMSFGKSGRFIKQYQLHHVYTDVAKYFNVGSTFSAWILQKTPTFRDTYFIDEDYSLDLRNYDSLPVGRPVRGVSIIEKVMSWEGEFLDPKLETNLKGTWSGRQNQFIGIDASLTQTNDYPYEVFHTNSLTYFVKDEPTDYYSSKIIISVSSPYPKIYNTPIGCAPGDLRTYILIDNEEHGNNILSYLNSKLFRFVWRRPGMNSWKAFRLPKLENKYWTDVLLYETFNLTKEEIKLVEQYAL